MVETAAHLVDHVFPRLPVRQWVLSLPKRLRYFHCCVIDGVFEPGRGDDEAVRFREAALSDADTQRVQALVRQRVLRWFVRHGYLEKGET